MEDQKHQAIDHQEADHQGQVSKLCRLYVGNGLHVVSEDTLRTYPDSYFAKLLSENFGDHKSKADIIFIGRDGKHFASILNHLRGSLNISKLTRFDLDELYVEADYYCLTKLRDMIGEELNIRERLWYHTPSTHVHMMHRNYEKMSYFIKQRNRLTYIILLEPKMHPEFIKCSTKLLSLMEGIMSVKFEVEFCEVEGPPLYRIKVYDPIRVTPPDVNNYECTDYEPYNIFAHILRDFHLIRDNKF